jgi:hypothetical protein
LSRREISWTIQQLRRLALSFGFRLKRRKETVAHASRRMVATQLVVNTKLSLPTQKRSQIRAAVHSYAAAVVTNDQPSDAYFHRVSGQLAYLAQHHPDEGGLLREELRQARKIDLKRKSRSRGTRGNWYTRSAETEDGKSQ